MEEYTHENSLLKFKMSQSTADNLIREAIRREKHILVTKGVPEETKEATKNDPVLRPTFKADLAGAFYLLERHRNEVGVLAIHPSDLSVFIAAWDDWGAPMPTGCKDAFIKGKWLWGCAFVRSPLVPQGRVLLASTFSAKAMEQSKSSELKFAIYLRNWGDAFRHFVWLEIDERFRPGARRKLSWWERTVNWMKKTGERIRNWWGSPLFREGEDAA